MSEQQQIDNRIPVNIITGFLGSGKTTLLNQWVNTEEFKDTLVLINEFGDVGLDHELVQSVDDTVGGWIRTRRDSKAGFSFLAVPYKVSLSNL